jgi:hypothetical protein
MFLVSGYGGIGLDLMVGGGAFVGKRKKGRVEGGWMKESWI